MNQIYIYLDIHVHVQRVFSIVNKCSLHLAYGTSIGGSTQVPSGARNNVQRAPEVFLECPHITFTVLARR